MKVSIIYNPSSGREKASASAAVARTLLSREGLDVGLHPTSGPRHAIDLARELAPAADVIVAVGGDGTINEVVNGIAEAGDAAGLTGQDCLCRLGIIPTGTVNVVARELRLPFDLKQACAVIASNTTRSLDLGKVNGHRFVLMTGAGIDAATIRNLDPRLKRKLRSLAFLHTGLNESLARPQTEFLVKVGDTSHRATFFVASNFRYYAGHLAMAPTADASDGLLDMVIFHGTTKPSVLAFWWRLLGRAHVRWRNVTYVQAERAELRLLDDRGPVWLQADGELMGELPAVVEVEPSAIEVLVP